MTKNDNPLLEISLTLPEKEETWTPEGSLGVTRDQLVQWLEEMVESNGPLEITGLHLKHLLLAGLITGHEWGKKQCPAQP